MKSEMSWDAAPHPAEKESFLGLNYWAYTILSAFLVDLWSKYWYSPSSHSVVFSVGVIPGHLASHTLNECVSGRPMRVSQNEATLSYKGGGCSQL